MNRSAILTVVILALVGVIAAWSKLRFVDQEGYDAPQRWRIEAHPRAGTHAEARAPGTVGG